MNKMKGTTKSGGRKHTLDKFYTKPEIALKCIQMLNLNKYDIVIEPAAGNGAFSKQIPNCVAYDIAPEDSNIIKQDWFEYETVRDGRNIIVIGNPPFGQQNSLALKFINHAASFAQTIAFVLPISFKKNSIQNRIHPNYHLVKEWVLPVNSFTLDNKNYNVPSVFQIWEYRQTERDIVKPALTSKYYSFVKQEEDYDFRVVRVGGKAGTAYVKKGLVSDQTNYFIKLNASTSVDVLVAEISSTVFPTKDFGVGPRTISKPELVEKLDIIVKKLLK